MKEVPEPGEQGGEGNEDGERVDARIIIGRKYSAYSR